MDKFETAAKYRAKMKKPSGVYLVIRARETAPTYDSREPRQSTHPNHRNLIKRVGFVDQYYFYRVDPYWGPISIRFSSHPPFNVTVYLNGNRWLAAEAVRHGLVVETKDNSVVRCSDPTALQALADGLDPRQLRAVCDHWVYRLFPVLTREERNRSFFSYRWFLHQVEMSHNLVFKDARTLTKTLEGHVDLNRSLLHPYSLKTIFRAKPHGSYKRDIAVSVHHAFGGLTVFSAQYGQTRIKQYNNHQQTFRTEVCVNDTTDLGVNKSIDNLPSLRECLLQLISRFQDLQSQARAQQKCVVSTEYHRGDLTALAKPGQVHRTTTPGIRLENERTLAVLTAVPQLVHYPGGFRSADLRPIVQAALGTDYSPSQANYDLRKLRGKRLVEQIPASRRYRLTSEGGRVAAFLSKLREQILAPVLGPILSRRPPFPPRRPLPPKDHTQLLIVRALFDLSDQLALRPAA